MTTDFERAAAAVDSLIAAIGPDQWAASTPCSEWTVQQIVEHLVDVNARMAGTEPGPFAGTPLDAYRASTRTLTAALAGDEDGALTRRLPLRMADLLVHGWDLAQATRQPAALPADLVEQAFEYVGKHAGAMRRSGMFADSQPVDPAAAVIDRLAALSGRPVG